VAVRAKNSCSSGVRSGFVDADVDAVDASLLPVWRCRANAGRGMLGWAASRAVLDVADTAERIKAKALVGGDGIILNESGC
jgi:hypothetical protein